MNCPNENTLALLMQGQLRSAERSKLEAHLDECADCLAVIGAAAQKSGSACAHQAESAQPLSDGAQPSAELLRGTTLGRYVLTGSIGAGAMGVVYAAYDPELDRKVAIKLLSPRVSHPDGQARLQREAQALARLSHPNVVSVFDVGEFRGQLFIAMEFVAGQTLSAWLQTGKRSFGEVLRVFAQAGAGLQAAHDAGIVHRDFKPDNALIDDTGRVRVMDFGLAAADPKAGAGEQDLPMSLDDRLFVSPNQPLLSTGSGTLLGTPYYMAPEQLAGRPASVQSDVYAFCVSLYEGLYGERPFAARNLHTLKKDKEQGHLSVPPSRAARRVPLWLRRIVLRGLEVDPAARWASLSMLLGELSRYSRRRRVLGFSALALGGLLAAIAATFLFAKAQAADSVVCAGAERHLQGIWDDATRARIEQSLGALAWKRVSQRLDTYAAEWVHGHRAACVATRRYHEQSEHVLEARMSCLEARRRALGTAVQLFQTADAALVRRADEIAASLPAIADCADIERAARTEALPEEPTRRAQVRELRTELQGALVFVSAQRLEEARRMAAALEPGVSAAHDAATRALYYYLRGAIAYTGGNGAAANTAMAEAAWASVEAGRTDLLARASASLTFINCGPLRRAEQGLSWGKLATAALANWGITTDAVGGTASALERSLAGCYLALGQLQDARLAAQRAVELAKKYPNAPRSDLNVALALDQLGRIARRKYDHAGAEAAFREALAVLSASPEGSDSPQMASVTVSLANTLAARGHFAEAAELFAQVIAREEQRQTPNVPNLATRLANLCGVKTSLGQLAAAEPICLRAMALRTSVSSLDSPDLAYDRVGLAELRRRQGRLREAEAQMELAYPVLLRLADESAATAREVGGAILRDQGKWQAALKEHHAAVAVLEKVSGRDEPALAPHLIGIGECLLKQKKAAQAVEPLRRAITLAKAGELDPRFAAVGRALLAQALWHSAAQRKDKPARDEAVALAEQAYKELGQLPTPERTQRELSAFMAARGPTGRVWL